MSRIKVISLIFEVTRNNKKPLLQSETRVLFSTAVFGQNINAA